MSTTSQTRWTDIHALLDRLDRIAERHCSVPGCVHHCVGCHEATWVGGVLLAA